MGRRKTSTGPSNKIPKVSIDLPKRLSLDFSESIKTILVEHSTESWNFWYGLLVKYKEDFNNLIISHKYKTKEGYHLGHWVDAQRARVHSHKDKVNKLNAIGFIWDVLEFNWNEGFSYLKKYIELNKNTLVPARFITEDGYSLGSWVSRQRTEKISKNRKGMLDDINFIWDVDEFRWNEGFNELEKYYAKNKNSLVIFQYVSPNGYKLGDWVSMQRERLNRNTLNQDRIKKLDNLNFVWTPLEDKWISGFKNLEAFYLKNKHVDVDYKFISSDGFKLGEWVSVQRPMKDRLSETKVKKLNKLNFVWEKRKPIDDFYQRLINYKKDFGDLFIDIKYETEDGYPLGKKTSFYRSKYLKFPDNHPIRTKLTSLGFIWDYKDQKWELSYQELKRYVDKNGSSIVPKAYKTRDAKDMPKLSYWVSVQRKNKKYLKPEQIDKLNKLFFVWDTLAYKWEIGFNHLVEFKKEFKQVDVIGKYVAPDGFNLHEWINTQRRERRLNRMSEERIVRLDSIGFVWSGLKGRNQFS